MKLWYPILALLTVTIVTAWAPAVNSLALSDAERKSLERGDVVVLDLLPPGGKPAAAQGGTAVSMVHASPDEVWQVLVDYPRHSGLYPRLTSAEVLESDPAHALVRYVVGVGPFTFGFHVNNYPDAGHRRLAWQLASGRSNQLFRQSWGYWQIEAHGDGAVLTYAMAAQTTLPAFLTRGAERESLVDTIKAVRDRAERGP
jgi:ribosome-associated toxin RatA of RatAB toxin-antitoxin module